MTRTFYSFQEFGEALGRSRRKPQKEWVQKEMTKISSCPRCGAQMKFTDGTNIMTCSNMIAKTIDGEQVTAECGFIKFLNPSTASYAQFLFDNLK